VIWRCDDAMRVLVDGVDLAGAGPTDLPAGWMADVARRGWTVEPDGAVVAVGPRAGDRARFADRTGWEGAVNGRGVVDLDLPLDPGPAVA
jgi:hypothetical protein